MRYLFLILLCCVAHFSVGAQTDTVATEVNTQPDERIMFQSKVRQLTSYLNEGNESAAGILFKDVSKSMEDFMQQTKAAMDSASGSEKRKLKDKLDRQRQLMAQFQSFKANLIRNRQSIATWTQQFEKTLYP